MSTHLLSDTATQLSSPSVVGIVQLIIMIILIPAVGYLFKQVTSLATMVGILSERITNVQDDIKEIKTDVKNISKRGTRNPPGQRDN